MKKQLLNGEFIELILDNGKVLAKKLDKKQLVTIANLNVSRDMNNCSNPQCLVLSNGGFFIFWLSKIEGGNEIYGRRYTAQGLAGKIIKFRIINLSSDKDLNIELQDDFFLIIKWQTNDNKIYKKVFNQDGEYKTDEEYVEDVKIEEVKIEDVKIEEPEKENITFSLKEKEIVKSSILTIDTKNLDTIEISNQPPPTPSMRTNLNNLKLKPLNNPPVPPPVIPKFFSSNARRNSGKFKMGFL